MTDKSVPDVTGAKGPDELRRQIQQTRKQLGGTVQELAEKADVKGRARARAADLKDRAGAMTVQLRSSAVHAGHSAQDTATRAGHTVHDQATRAGHAMEHRVPLRFRSAFRAGQRHPRPVLVAAAAVGALIAVQAMRRRGRH
ncbi:DUF3618 domain-containing protein [Streptomyces sp. NPDC003635]